jgi:hypothetical protein
MTLAQTLFVAGFFLFFVVPVLYITYVSYTREAHSPVTLQSDGATE